jgi:hypothetical protein
MWRNSTVCLVGIALGLGGTGCIVESGDPDHPRGGHRPATTASGVAVAWDLAYVDGRLIDCQTADTPTVTLTVTSRASGIPHVASFPCEDGVGVALGIPPGIHDIALDLRDSQGRIVSTLSNDLQIYDGTVTEPEEALFPVQNWDLLWTIAGRGGRPVTCREVGAVSVEFSAQLPGETPEIYFMPCEDYGLVSTAIREGDYRVRMRLLDYRNQTMADTGFGLELVTFDRPAELEAEFRF